jgi:iron(III) transport system substrate-binding protein
MHIRRRAIVVALLVLSALTVACGGDSSDKLTIYSGRNEALIQPIIDKFEEASGIEVEVRYGSSSEMAAALLEEGSGTPADVFLSQEVGALGALSKADLVAPLPEDVVSSVLPRFQPGEGNPWVGVTGRSRVIVYNEDLVPDPPTSVVELTDPSYRGQVAWAPSNAGFQAFMTAFRVTQGEQAAAQWLEDMKANGVQTYNNNVDILKAVNDGVVPMGLINHYYWGELSRELGAENMKAQLMFPEGDDPGALVNATAVGIMADSADNPDALEFVKYLLSPEGQEYFVSEVFEYPVVPGVEGPEGFPKLEELEGPAIDLTDLESLEVTQKMLTDAGLLS